MTEQIEEPKNIFAEIGTPGLEAYSGFISEAHLTELRWPGVYPLYSRYRRADPEVAIARNVLTTMARGVRLEFSADENASGDDKRFADFGNQALDDVAGGQGALLETIVQNVPFYGWGWFEALPGVRSRGWRAPDPDDEWESEYDDGLIGFRRLAWRSPSSFYAWSMNERTGKLYGIQQMDMPNPVVMIPLNRSLHLTFGDTTNPEGLSPLEALYRLERYKYALELIQGIGYEHAAGYLEVRSTQDLTPADKVLIRAMARAILSAQEANYAAWPSHLTGEIKDIAFAAGVGLLEVIRHYHMLKLQLFAMQWAAIATTAGAGAYSAMSDSSSMFMMTFNAMMDGFANQIDAQIGRRLYRLNRDKFPGSKARPRIRATAVNKSIDLTSLGQLISAFGMDNLGDEDWLAIRKASKILPETLPEKKPVEEQPENVEADDEIEDDANEEDMMDGEEMPSKEQRQQAAEMAERQRYWMIYLKEHPEAANG